MATVSGTVTVGQGWDASDYANKEHPLQVVRDSSRDFFSLLETPENWELPITVDWQVGDLTGHMIDVIEGYLAAFGLTTSGGEPEPPYGLRVMKTRLNERAQSLRSLTREERLQRLKDDFAQLMTIFESLDEGQWTGMLVSHPYMGPVPAFCYPAFQLMDYGVHTWDIREALGLPQGLSPDVADFLVPFMFSIMQGTCDTDQVSSLPGPIGFRISGRNAGTWRVTLDDGSFQYEPGPVDGLPMVFEYDPASFVLTTFGRCRAGTDYGDRELAARFRSMFFAF